jgi:adenylylsulfate kinase-like enzyme
VRKGGVVWVTGLSGAGKSTVAAALKDRLVATGVKPVLLDGDCLRAILPVTLGHEPEERRSLAMFYARLARELAAQGHLVICSTVSLFHEVHAWNRLNIPRYLEVWLRVPVTALRDRGRRAELYQHNGGAGGAAAGVGGQVVGVDTVAEFPLQPDVVISNYGDATVEQAVDRVVIALDRMAAPLA